MATRTQSAFQTVKTEGALLPADLLKRVSDGDKEIEGLSPESYHLDPTDKINEATNRAWIACRDAWQRFQKQRAELPDSDKGTTLTRERWLLVLFRELGYGRLQTAKAFEIEGKTYALSHGWGASPIHLISFRYDLDTTSHGVFRTSPHSLVQELLNRSDDHLWAFVSNGLQLRILRDNVSFTRPAYVEFDLEAMLEGEVYSDFLPLWLLCHQSRVESEIPEQCWLEKWHQTAKKQGTRVLDRLRDGVERSIEAFGQGFLAHRGNGALREKLADGKLTTQDYYHQLLRLVYRLIFLFVAEDRDLLLTPDADATTRKRFEEHYSLTRIRRLAERRRTRHSDMWQGVKFVFKLLYKGEPRLGLPALGSMLFSDKTMPDLDECELANDRMREAIWHLSFTVDRHGRRHVDYKNLGSEELGSVYESLLELHPDVNADAATFELSTVAGSERKTTGSYYTPSSLINCLLDSALDPVVAEALKKPDREKTILDLKVCDPACGSGHFLIAAANRLSHHLATARTGDEEPSPAARRVAFRDVVSHSIYGVDINPMAVELCKVALWLESIDPGKPLSFLDHRILCGNSLIGATPRLLAEGIPDDAFKPIEGDDKAVVNEYKRRNKDEKKGQLQLDFGAMPSVKLGNLVQTFANLAAMDDGSLEDVEAKEKKYAEFVDSTGYQSARLLADAWCAAFVWKKNKSTDDCITENWFRRIEANPHCLPPWMREEIDRLRDQYQFFHWHLAFPDAFRVPSENEDAENEQAGWTGGFDIVLGNPSWERIKLQEKEWFAPHRPDIATARRAATRRAMIAALKNEDPTLYQAFADARRGAEGESHLVRDAGLFPLCGRGDVNTYALFAELNRTLIARNGRVGCIVPTGIATDDTTKFFFREIVVQRNLASLMSFENEEFIFPQVHHAMKFSLLTLAGGDWRLRHSDFVFFAREPSQLSDDSRRFSLTPENIAKVNPNTGTCPVFRTRRDADMTTLVYERVPILVEESQDGSEGRNPWGVSFTRLFDMTNDSHLFHSKEQLRADGYRLVGHSHENGIDVWLPLYEAKMLYHFDHRYSTYAGATQANLNAGILPQPTEEQKADPRFTSLPNYWVQEQAVDKARESIPSRRWTIAFRGIAQSVNERTIIASFLPYSAVGNSAPVISLRVEDARLACCLLSNMCSLIVDYIARNKAGGSNLNFFIMKQLPILPPDAYTVNDVQFVVPRVVELTYTAWDMQAFAHDMGYRGEPFRYDETRRAVIRGELDAYFALRYGLDRDGVSYVLDPVDVYGKDFPGETFRVLKDKEIEKLGRYRTKDTILEIYDEMAESIKTGKPYQTRLDPPPGPPADAEGNFLPLPQWLPGQPRPADWPPHIHGPCEVYDWAKANGIDWRTLLEDTPTTCGETTK